MRVRILLLMLLMGATVAPAAEQAAHGLVIEPTKADLGTTLEGKDATTTLLLRNASDESIYISRVETSCGCTTAEPDSRVLDPGAFTQLRVRIDTMGKRGRVEKSITVTDDKGHQAQALLSLTVRTNPHLGMKSGRSIFAAKCASCHAEPAYGKVKGSGIYAAVCAMCHGVEAEGGYAPVLKGRDVALIRHTLYHGMGNHMPAFSRAKGGPLTDAQIEVLSRWLSGLE